MIKGMVSCVIPTYKRSDSLISAINSVLNQNYKNLEVIVVDDNDPNDEYSIIVQNNLKQITDNRLIYIQQDKHNNGAVARNLGILSSKGEYIAFLDDDDVWMSNKLDLQIDILNTHVEYSAVSCLSMIYTKGKLISKSLGYSEKRLHRKVIDRSISIYTPTVIFKKKALLKTGIFDEKLIRHQDLQLFLDFLDKERMYVLNKHLVIINTDYTENRLRSDKFELIKNVFFTRMAYHFKKYNFLIRHRIYCAHYFEIILVAIREKKFKRAIKYFLKVGLNVFAYYDLLRRFIKRKRAKV